MFLPGNWEPGLLSDWFSSHLRTLALYPSLPILMQVSILSVTHLLSNHHYLSRGGGRKGKSILSKVLKLIRQSEVSIGNRGLSSPLTFQVPWAQCFSTATHPIPLGDIWQDPEMVWVVTTGEVAAGIQWVETKNAAECSYNAQDSPHFIWVRISDAKCQQFRCWAKGRLKEDHPLTQTSKALSLRSQLLRSPPRSALSHTSWWFWETRNTSNSMQEPSRGWGKKSSF